MDGSSCGLLQPKYGGKIIDIVSRDVQRPEDKAQALEDVKGTILYIVIIVVVGYLSFLINYTLIIIKDAMICNVM
jgi:cobalamin biosynthesis protein CobD/CbiB